MSLPLRVLEILAADLVRQLMADLGEARDTLRRMGFRDPERAIEILNKLAEPGERPPLPADLFRELVESPDPDMALSNFERLVMAAVSAASFFHTLETDPRACHVLIHILGGSQFLSDILVRDPQYFYWLTETSDRLVDVPGRVDLLAEFEAGIARFGSTRARLNALRRFNRKELLRLGAGDLVGERPIEDVAQGLSDLADVCLQTLLNVLTTEMEANHGSPKNQDGNPAEFIIVALGKLGGRELNFSSDIDLMFVYSKEGETDGGEGRVSNQEFYTTLSERLIHAVSESTEEGFLYKVDLRQRPDGSSGALTMPMSGYESYYARRGELWERQMLIKARICAGSAKVGSRFLHRLRPFIYPGYFEVSPVKEIHRIKLSIEDRIGEKGTRDTHLKLRSGGIRDVEFIVQCLQMLVGRVHTEARSANTLEAIGQLQRASALSEAEATGIREAYLFFRRVEHRMQMMHGQSDYILPQSEEDQRSLARSLGFRKASVYRANLSQHLDTVRYVYRGVFSEEETGEGRSLVLCPINSHAKSLDLSQY
jgi:glutamate-ammonia-ligase adenylyltransferase